MASCSLTSTLTSPSKSPFYPQPLSQFSFTGTLKPFRTKSKPILLHNIDNSSTSLTVKAQTLDLSVSFFEGGGFGSDDDPTSVGTATAVEDKEEPQCPPGLRQYETMMVLRPDMSEDERLALTQKYEELLVAGGGMYVEVFNRGVIPLAYSIRKRNKAGESNTYLDGIYLLFTYFTKPESIEALEVTMKTDDDVIRSSSFKVKKQKLKRCRVCLGKFKITEELLQVPYCKHVFHVECLHHWLHSNTTCPLCQCSIVPVTKLYYPTPDSVSRTSQDSGARSNQNQQNSSSKQQLDDGSSSVSNICTEQLTIHIGASSDASGTCASSSGRLPEMSNCTGNEGSADQESSVVAQTQSPNT